MREIVSKPLDRESFRPYGDFVDLLHIKQMDAMAGADNIFIPDLTTLRLDERMQASVCVARVSQCERIITAVEYHGFTSEGILPLDGDIDIFVGPSSFQVNPASSVPSEMTVCSRGWQNPIRLKFCCKGVIP